MRLAAALALIPLSCGQLSKVPLSDVEAQFLLADASWFDEEDTLFVFYELQAEQGIGVDPAIEIRYRTATEDVPWTALDAFEMVHPHEPVDCGENALCGSASIHVPFEPSEVDLRLRYHRQGELVLDTDTVFNVVGPGPAHTHRSLIVYGVFDEANEHVQWRTRNRFPTIRNMEASELGLRRELRVENQRYGNQLLANNDNPYGYALPCDQDWTPTDVRPVETTERAVFSLDPLPLASSEATTVCGSSTVQDARGSFVADAIARRNPRVRPAFPVLRSPINDALQIKFFLGPCDEVISPLHEAMQRQRLQLGNIPVTCIDDWEEEGFEEGLTVLFREAIEDRRTLGQDMVLVIGLHRREDGVAEMLERVLRELVPPERAGSTPRLAGAFVFDSEGFSQNLPRVAQSTLWCPAGLGLDQFPDASGFTCPVKFDLPIPPLGPLSFDTLPILPNRDDYLEFLQTYSESQAGSVELVRYLTPEFTPTSDHVDNGFFGVATFLNGEQISAENQDAFSYCEQEEGVPIVFRSPLMESPLFTNLIELQCLTGELPADFCVNAAQGLLPLSWLPFWHNVARESDYQIGLNWDFPFLMRVNYRAVLGGAVSAFGFSVPFGFGQSSEGYFGTPFWLADEFPMEDELLQCTAFCSNPTFDGAGVYNVLDRFRSTYSDRCYRPNYPSPGDSGFPLDP